MKLFSAAAAVVGLAATRTTAKYLPCCSRSNNDDDISSTEEVCPAGYEKLPKQEGSQYQACCLRNLMPGPDVVQNLLYGDLPACYEALYGGGDGQAVMALRVPDEEDEDHTSIEVVPYDASPISTTIDITQDHTPIDAPVHSLFGGKSEKSDDMGISSTAKSGKAFASKAPKQGKSVDDGQHDDVNPKSAKVGDPMAKVAKASKSATPFAKSGKSKTGKLDVVGAFFGRPTPDDDSVPDSGYGEIDDVIIPMQGEEVQEPQPKGINAKWFQTSDPAYGNIMNNEVNSELHSHTLAGLFCHTQDMFLCTYQDYCWGGQGSWPYMTTGAESENVIGPHSNAQSGPPVQWAPMYSDDVSSDGSENDWVQVGKLDYNGEAGTCWGYRDWTRGYGGDIEDSTEIPNRMWILCCEKESEVEKKLRGRVNPFEWPL